MSEWVIRLMCVFLGGAITFGATETLDVVNELQNKEAEVTMVEEEPPIIIEMPSPTPEEEEIIQDYELEAELKYQEYLESATATPTEEVEEDQAEATDEEIVEEVTGDENAESGAAEGTGEEGEAEEVTETVVEIPANSIEAAPVKWIRDYPLITIDSKLVDKECVRSSYDETMAVNAFDKKVIENSQVDFSDVKITILGDSITAGNTLPEEEMEIYNWPAQLKELLGCKEVVNLGIGGSNISKCTDNYPMCTRWSDIEKDSDIIIVMGGTNDMLFEDRGKFGELEYDKRMVPGTFCGDLDKMLSAMNWTYVLHNDENYCKMIYINPMSTIHNDGVYASNPDVMVKQEEFADAINEIAPHYGFEVIDLYNNNILNSHDRDIEAEYVPDGVHCNKEGYTILAEHIASQLIQRVEQ